jgi:RNA polymerase sigma-70 factor (ECF subfamily)
MPPEPAELELMARIAEGDDDAMSQLYLDHESGVYAFAMKKLNDSQAAADIVHDVMIAIWKGAAGFQGRSSLKSWVLGIAHNKIVDHIRRSVRHDADELDESMNQTEDDSINASPLDLAQAAQNSEFLRYCLEKLSDLHRQVVHLAFFEDLPYGEIAEIIGKPEGTIKTRMFHARQALKRCLQGKIDPELQGG